MEDILKRTDIFVETLAEEFVCAICQGVVTKAKQFTNGSAPAINVQRVDAL
jgi:hypothetical protein